MKNGYRLLSLVSASALSALVAVTGMNSAFASVCQGEGKEAGFNLYNHKIELEVIGPETVRLIWSDASDGTNPRRATFVLLKEDGYQPSPRKVLLQKVAGEAPVDQHTGKEFSILKLEGVNRDGKTELMLGTELAVVTYPDQKFFYADGDTGSIFVECENFESLARIIANP